MHYAAHEPIDVRAVDADVLLCSPYKFCGPHLGMAYVRESLAETWRPYKARPAATTPTARRFETGTLPYELLPAHRDARLPRRRSAGWRGAGPRARARRAVPREHARRRHALRPADDGGPRPDVPHQPRRRAPRATCSRGLAERGIGVWSHDNYYSLGLYPKLGYDEAVRLGMLHYNTAEEVERLTGELARLVAEAPAGARAG